jgi:hypothetical protein
MKASTLGPKSYLISWFLFPLVLLALFAFQRHFDGNKGEASFLAIIGVISLLGLALAWQALTIHHHKRRIFPYVFAIIYATALFVCIIIAAA